MLQRALGNPEDVLRRPQTLDDTQLVSLTDNTLRRIAAEVTPVTMADTIDAIVSQIRQILYGVAPGHWSDIPPISLADALIQLESLSGGFGPFAWTAIEPIVVGQCVYAAGSGAVGVARASNIMTKNVVGIAAGSAAIGQAVNISATGREVNSYSNLIPAEKYWLQATGFPGLLPPTQSGYFKLSLGIAKFANTLHVQLGEPRINP